MCRYFSGFFYRHPFLAPFDYYWRVEPHVQFLCNLRHDPFRYAAQNNISYGARRGLLCRCRWSGIGPALSAGCPCCCHPPAPAL